MTTKRSPMKAAFPWQFALQAVGGLFAAKKAKKAHQKQKNWLQKQWEAANKDLKAQEQAYKDLQFKNPYEDMENFYEGMENVFEDITVNQQAAQFQMEQGRQQRANILQGLRGAAGTSGIAGLAQALAQKGTMQAQQAAVSIGQQETANQRIAAQEASRLDQMQRQAQTQLQMRERYGGYLQEQQQISRQETLLAGAYGRATAAKMAQQEYRATALQSGAQVASGFFSGGGMDWLQGGLSDLGSWAKGLGG